jgi:hypothetical protein
MITIAALVALAMAGCGTDRPDESSPPCEDTGTSMDQILCAFDLWDEDIIRGSSFGSPTHADTTGALVAVERFGHDDNGLHPRGRDSYVLMATGLADGTHHSIGMGGVAGEDPYASGPLSGEEIFDVMELTIDLKAPDGAQGFSFDYVFLSSEYEEWIGTEFNDKFYVVIEAASTNGGEPTVINFTECRHPAGYHDFECQPGQIGCVEGEVYCYIAINTALSECCWFQGCPDGEATTDLSGTGFTCASSMANDGPSRGSSTGWLRTTWPIDNNESFTLTFHIHDTGDGKFDSEVILDNFDFRDSRPDPETIPIE